MVPGSERTTFALPNTATTANGVKTRPNNDTDEVSVLKYSLLNDRENTSKSGIVRWRVQITPDHRSQVYYIKK